MTKLEVTDKTHKYLGTLAVFPQKIDFKLLKKKKTHIKSQDLTDTLKKIKL